MQLEVPAVSYRRVSRGETWESLAAETLGLPRRSDVLALANDSMPWLFPEEGAEIVVPYNLRVVVRPNETPDRDRAPVHGRHEQGVDLGPLQQLEEGAGSSRGRPSWFLSAICR